VFVRLPFNVPGLQSLTPQKILLPLVLLTLVRHVWTRGTQVVTPIFLATATLFAWLLVSVLFNARYALSYNLRAWSWLTLDLGFILAVQEGARIPAGRRLLAGSVTAAVAAIAVLGFVELIGIDGLDPFFQLFRPNWLGLGLRGPAPGPGSVLPVHAYVGGQ